MWISIATTTSGILQDTQTTNQLKVLSRSLKLGHHTVMTSDVFNIFYIWWYWDKCDSFFWYRFYITSAAKAIWTDSLMSGYQYFINMSSSHSWPTLSFICFVHLVCMKLAEVGPPLSVLSSYRFYYVGNCTSCAVIRIRQRESDKVYKITQSLCFHAVLHSTKYIPFLTFELIHLCCHYSM